MRNLCLSILAVFLSMITSAQGGSIQGRLLDEKGAAIRFANVSLLKTEKGIPSLVGRLTDSLGNFSIPVPEQGSYYLQFTAIGFLKLETDSFQVSGPEFFKDFGTIVLKPDIKNMDNVTLTALRPTIVQLADRMVVSVEGTAMAQGNNAFNVLSKAPGVFVDHEGNIQLNGRSGVTVMIDGRLTHLSARDLRNMLESMSAENVKSIELITNPSARYDAEVTAGIINLVLKKNTFRGINGSVNAGYTYNFKQHAYSSGTSINYKSRRWNFLLNLDFTRRVGGREATFTRIFYGTNKTTYFDQDATGNYTVQGPPSIRLGTDYDISSRHSVGGIFNFVTNTAHSDFLTDTYIGNAPHSPYQYIDANNYNTNTFKSYTANLHYTGKLDTSGTTLSSDFDYARITNRGEGNYFNTFRDLTNSQQTKDNLYTNTPNGYKIYSAKIDFSHPLKKGQKFDMGAKASHVVSDNDSRFYFNNNGLILDPQRTNHFYYEENIYAAYLNWNGNLSKKLSLQLGLRAEETQSTGNSLTTGQITQRSYLDLFPSVFLQQKVNDNYGINYNYSRRLSRPNYGNLNPFRAYRDPYTWTEGNPYLRPQYTHSFTVSQTFKKQYILQLYYQLTKDVMSEIPILDVANAITVYTTGNVDDGQSTGMTAIAPIKIMKKWDTRNTLQLAYNKYTTLSNNGALENSQLFFLFQSIHTILLPKDLRMEITFLYRGPQASGLYHMAAMNWMDVAFKKSFFKKKFDLSLTATDIFKGYRYLWTTNIAGNKNEFNQYFRFRSMGVSLRYNFSKGQKVNVKQRSGLEELNRT